MFHVYAVASVNLWHTDMAVWEIDFSGSNLRNIYNSVEQNFLIELFGVVETRYYLYDLLWYQPCIATEYLESGWCDKELNFKFY